MQQYANKSKNAGVKAFEAGSDFITIQFVDGSVYLYNDKYTGKQNIEKMKTLAFAGEGLTTFINQFVREKYAAKLS